MLSGGKVPILPSAVGGDEWSVSRPCDFTFGDVYMYVYGMICLQSAVHTSVAFTKALPKLQRLLIVAQTNIEMSLLRKKRNVGRLQFLTITVENLHYYCLTLCSE